MSLVVFEVYRFTIKHICDGFLDVETTTRLKIIFFLDGPLDVLEICDNKWGVLRKECGLEICRETYS